ncbi:hypothetical protein M407DRAFT_118491 [Tulasnella calospora MUT 4182]|uniref:Uncharacterized protein n=1 Tax=Tulasnella calospora MUT 4182 TaxID=1051891 RepID=A0A0C3LDH6_9AGAM|nr:hypothetical protein M407DRAFT_118491 [Tulasnella calospora MUT 4182]
MIEAPEGLARWRIGILQFDHLNQAGERLRQMHTFEASGHGDIILLIGNYIVDGDSIVRASEINPGAATMHGGIGTIPASRLILAFEPEGFAVFDNSKAEIACFGPMVATGPIDFDPTVVPLSITPIPGTHLPPGSPYFCRFCHIIHSFGGIRGSSAVLSTYPTNTGIYIELKDSPLQISNLRVLDSRVQYHGMGHAKTIDGLVVIAGGPFNLTVVFEDGQTGLNELPVTRRSQIPLGIGATYSFICPIGGVVGSVVHNKLWIWSTD